MRIYPAIDIQNGQCVRLRQGHFQDVAIYSSNPYKIALKWQQEGASYIHMVDLDGALMGHSVNDEVIHEIAASTDMPIQVGGGIRTMKDIENKLMLGIERVIIGTKAVQDPGFIKKAIKQFGADKVVIGIDAKNGMVAIEGWEVLSTQTVLQLCSKMQAMGVKTVVYTDIAKDGMLDGPNIEQTKAIIDRIDMEMILQGGIRSLKDLEMAKNIGVSGVIIGKALYEDHLDLKSAIDIFERGRNYE